MFQAPGQMIENHLAPGIAQFNAQLLQPTVKQGQVAAIGLAGVIGKALFQPEGIEVLVDQRVFDSRHGRSATTRFCKKIEKRQQLR
ncbi:hypothetical protein D3C80_1454490 [compost metagenome]